MITTAFSASTSGISGRLGVRLWAGAVLAFTLLAADAGIGTGGTGSYHQGRIAAVKPLVLNNVRFDDSAAQVLDDDGNPSSRDALQPGMTAEIDGTAVRLTTSGATATASRVRFSIELAGVLGTLDRANGLLGLLGQTVLVDAKTVIDARLPGGLDGLAPGQLLQVSAAFDAASGRYVASRLEPAARADVFKIRGVVAGLDPAARVLRIGGAEFAYASTTSVPSGLAVGSFVKLQLAPGPVETTRWTVTAFSSATTAPPDGREGEVAGLVSSVVSPTVFSINGQAVDATGAAVSGAVVLGARVEAQGSFQGGVLKARQVEVGDGNDGIEYESKGAVGAVDATAQTFVLRGKVISTARSDLRVVGGTLADLTPRKRVEVHGLISFDGQRVEATEIVFQK